MEYLTEDGKGKSKEIFDELVEHIDEIGENDPLLHDTLYTLVTFSLTLVMGAITLEHEKTEEKVQSGFQSAKEASESYSDQQSEILNQDWLKHFEANKISFVSVINKFSERLMSCEHDIGELRKDFDSLS